MNKILLINRINTKSFQKDKRRIFFLIGDIEKENKETYLMDTLNKVDFLNKEDIIYKYNGVEIAMKEKKIPHIINIFMNAGIDVYSIYELYDPI